MNKKVLLMILDGWGIAEDSRISAIDQAKTPFIDSLYNKYSNTTLNASGSNVGLPHGQMGNSEVGHMTIGSGRIVAQDLVRLNNEIKNDNISKNLEFKKLFNIHFRIRNPYILLVYYQKGECILILIIYLNLLELSTN